uniref:Uncharacterized protein n=1 Tax=Rhizophora mucronata TaxID=61149 RepID=A0A2P2IM86_RHIMU
MFNFTISAAVCSLHYFTFPSMLVSLCPMPGLATVELNALAFVPIHLHGQNTQEGHRQTTTYRAPNGDAGVDGMTSVIVSRSVK